MLEDLLLGSTQNQLKQIPHHHDYFLNSHSNSSYGSQGTSAFELATKFVLVP